MKLKSLIGNHKGSIDEYPAHVAETLLMNGTHEPADDASRAKADQQKAAGHPAGGESAEAAQAEATPPGPEAQAAEAETGEEEEDAFEDVKFATAAARKRAEEAGLTADSFKRQRKSSDRGFTVADVKRLAEKAEAEE